MKNKTHKIALRANNAKQFKNFANQQHKSLSACIRTVREACALTQTFACEADKKLVEEFRSLLRKDCIKVEQITPAWLVERLNGTKFCKDRVLGRTDKDGNFSAYEAWTPGRVVDFVRRASTESWHKFNASVREARKSTLSK